MSCKRIVLHFGMEKTGSTSVRAALVRHLEDPEHYFVTPGMRNAGRCLAAAFKDDPLHFHYFKRLGITLDRVPKLRAEALAALAAEFAKADGKTAIVLAEAVSAFNSRECSKLLQYLRQYSGDVRAVAYVRKPKAYIESYFQQQSRSARPSS